jgi:hypothetical protein
MNSHVLDGREWYWQIIGSTGRRNMRKLIPAGVIPLYDGKHRPDA